MKTHPNDTAIQEYARQPGATHGHIDQCSECLERVRQYRQLFAALNRQEIPEPKARIADAVMARLPESSIKENGKWKLVLAAASLIAAAGVSGLMILSGPTLEGNALALLAMGGAGLAIFLVCIQWRRYHKLMQLIKTGKMLQPE